MKDGGPAFPTDHVKHYPSHSGMSLRDYFAAKALQGIVALQDGCGDKHSTARYCYEYADAMLAARATPPTEGR